MDLDHGQCGTRRRRLDLHRRHHYRHRLDRPGTRRRPGRGAGAERHRPAARRGQPHHPHAVRQPRDDRIDGDLLLCHLDDPEGNCIELLQHTFGQNDTRQQPSNARPLGQSATLGQVSLNVQDIKTSLQYLNKGNYYSNDNQLGVRGRVELADVYEAVSLDNVIYHHDPETNEVIDYFDLTGNDTGLRLYLEELIIDERARELAYEGERFYDLMRVAKRRNDPSFLASRVASEFPEGKREEIYNKLLNEENWYIPYFD